MRRISHETFANLFSIAYLALMTNVLLLASCLPMVLLLVTTDPAHSWPLLAVAAPLCAPGIAAAYAVFREHAQGGLGPNRAFWAGLKRTWRKALVLGAILTVIAVVILVDIRAFADSQVGVLLVPVLLVLAVLTATTAVLALVALAEEPGARVRDILRASVVLGTRRWYLSAVTLLALGIQAWAFTSMPAIGIGMTAAPILYVAWANSRYTLRPVLDLEPAVA